MALTALTKDYTIGWICALPSELSAVQSMLSGPRQHLGSSSYLKDSNTYTFGRYHGHNIVLTNTTASNCETVSKNSIVLREMLKAFPKIRLVFVIGTECSEGIPGAIHDILLGDVMTSQSEDEKKWNQNINMEIIENEEERNIDISLQLPDCLHKAVLDLQSRCLRDEKDVSRIHCNAIDYTTRSQATKQNCICFEVDEAGLDGDFLLQNTHSSCDNTDISGNGARTYAASTIGATDEKHSSSTIVQPASKQSAMYTNFLNQGLLTHDSDQETFVLSQESKFHLKLSLKEWISKCSAESQCAPFSERADLLKLGTAYVLSGSILVLSSSGWPQQILFSPPVVRSKQHVECDIHILSILAALTMAYWTILYSLLWHKSIKQLRLRHFLWAYAATFVVGSNLGYEHGMLAVVVLPIVTNVALSCCFVEERFVKFESLSLGAQGCRLSW